LLTNGVKLPGLISPDAFGERLAPPTEPSTQFEVATLLNSLTVYSNGRTAPLDKPTVIVSLPD
jgi:hypothetical protein